MQFKTLAFTLFAGAVAAQSIQELVASVPKCAQPCIEKAAEQVGCKKDDVACQCNKADELTAAGTTCVATSCTNVADLTSTLEISTEICVKVAAAAGGAAASSAVSSATQAIGAASSSLAGAIPTIRPSSTTSTVPTNSPTAGAARNGAVLGLAAAAAVAMAL
ncbi:CFEM domain-containing protein [Microdochium nivale]|nr:CFEM domain-containing protein [Microdochium nivale]